MVGYPLFTNARWHHDSFCPATDSTISESFYWSLRNFSCRRASNISTLYLPKSTLPSKLERNRKLFSSTGRKHAYQSDIRHTHDDAPNVWRGRNCRSVALGSGASHGNTRLGRYPISKSRGLMKFQPKIEIVVDYVEISDGFIIIRLTLLSAYMILTKSR